MADTGSFPIALPVPSATRRPWWTSHDPRDVAWKLGAAAFAMFLLGAGSAAAGFQLEAQGYGSLVLVGGGLIGIATAVPAWLLFRAPTQRK